MKALVLKEFRTFFSTLLGYVVICAFLMLIGLFLWIFPGEWNVLDNGQANLDSLFIWAPWVFVFLIPAITMRSFSEEMGSGTFELLLTKPISEVQVVFGKFIGALSVLHISLVPTLLFIPVVGWLGQPQWNLDLGAIYGSYLGLVLLGSAFCAIGIFASALTSNSLVAFLTTVITLVIGFIGFTALASFDWLGAWELPFIQLGMQSHYQSLSRGLLNGSDSAYFLFLDFIFLWSARLAIVWQRSDRQAEVVRWLLGLAIGFVLYLIALSIPFQVDLTSDKRYTMTESSSDLINSLEDEMFVTCYLDGEFPANWKRLEGAIRNQLQDFAKVANGNLRFQFVDIYEIDDRQTIGQNEEKLVEQGLQFTRIAFEENGLQAFKTVWPAAILTYGGNREVVQFFKSEVSEPTDVMIQGSINAIEYELTSGIRKLLRPDRPKIAIIEGHGELGEAEMADLTMALDEDYDVMRVEIDGQLNILSELLDGMPRRSNRFDLVVIAGPDSAIDPKDQVIIDQFIMNGGRALWMIDPLLTNRDSLSQRQMTMATTNDLGISDQLFQYGVRYNRNLVVDAQCAPMVMDAGPNGDQRNMQVFNWYFAPIAIPQGISHPITTNLDPIHFDFVSSIDTVSSGIELRKTVLLTSSEMSRAYKSPVRVSGSIVELEPDYFARNAQPSQALAILVEGKFQSAFKNRLPAALTNDPGFAFEEESLPTAQIFVGDGDLARNKVKTGPNGPMILPLGFDRYAGRVVYDNKDFLRNAISYLLDESSAISVRSRTIALRQLNKERIRQQRLGWQTFAMGLPMALTLGFGLLFTSLRRKRFAKLKRDITSSHA
jgi:ABC-2 type transport system permease protein